MDTHPYHNRLATLLERSLRQLRDANRPMTGNPRAIRGIPVVIKRRDVEPLAGFVLTFDDDGCVIVKGLGVSGESLFAHEEFVAYCDIRGIENEAA